MSKKTQTPLFITVNKNGFMSIWYDEPIKNEKLGKWRGSFPFCNSIMYNEFAVMIKEANINFISEPIRIDVMI